MRTIAACCFAEAGASLVLKGAGCGNFGRGVVCATRAAGVKSQQISETRSKTWSVPGFLIFLAAEADVAAGGAVVAAVAPNEGLVAAVRAFGASQHRCLRGHRSFKNTHLLLRTAVVIEGAEHGVA